MPSQTLRGVVDILSLMMCTRPWWKLGSRLTLRHFTVSVRASIRRRMEGFGWMISCLFVYLFTLQGIFLVLLIQLSRGGSLLTSTNLSIALPIVGYEINSHDVTATVKAVREIMYVQTQRHHWRMRRKACLCFEDPLFFFVLTYYICRFFHVHAASRLFPRGNPSCFIDAYYY